MGTANIFGLVSILCVLGAVMVIGGIVSIAGRLPMNPLVGIRIPSTMVSDAAWKAAHKSAGPYLVLAGLCAFAGVVLALLDPSLEMLALILLPAAGVVACVIIAAIVASRSAMRVPFED